MSNTSTSDDKALQPDDHQREQNTRVESPALEDMKTDTQSCQGRYPANPVNPTDRTDRADLTGLADPTKPIQALQSNRHNPVWHCVSYHHWAISGL